MTRPFEVDFNAGRGTVAGRIDVTNAGQALADGAKFSIAATRIEIDLQDLESADSVTLAVLLAWASAARRKGGELVYRGIPARLRAIAHLSGAESLLGIDARAIA
ncbi:MAG: STAS domain-containing protein [Dokdonella sp.]|uniref:STAS domain-containing protein n=1 Tax=Dokdonella sp. TaxID=2291710 RepID=UPI002CBCD037|nr:STAS domain-containing protein [Dokdonella sp.]HOX70502.1 STAS domain-containing protein [Dokdonella sp.]HPG95266.1 STAS domain-containing protein [Dokdonella sp.]HPN78240.1 STAS domain-containing protein [Dokdonella sp.]